MKNSISTSLGLILVSCLLLVLGSGLLVLITRSSDREIENAEEHVREIKDILLKSIEFSMGEGVTSAEPFARMLSDMPNIREIRLIPTAIIDPERQKEIDEIEQIVLRSGISRFMKEEFMSENVIRAIEPLLTTQSCIECHEARIGDPLAVISIRYSMDETESSIQSQKILGLLIVIISIGLTFTIMMVLINRKIMQDIKRIILYLKNFSVGNIKQPVTTNRKDELGDAMKSLRVLQDNLTGKTEIASQIAEGNLNVEVQVMSEEDELGFAMQKMRDNIHSSISKIEKQNWLKSGISGLNDTIRGELELKELCQKAISYTSKYSDAKIGAIYINNGEDTFELIGSYAFTKRKGNRNIIKLGEGLIGQAALERQHIIFNNVPENYVKINSGLGEALPLNIIVSPLVYQDEISGVIEIGSSYEFKDEHMEFMRQVSESIAIAINSAKARAKTQQLLYKTQEQAEELQTQQEELRVTNEELQAQQEELRVTNEELEEQTKALKMSEESLKQKHNELIKANEDLEKQKSEIFQKNKDLEIIRNEIEEKAAQLELTSKYKSEFLANMSHELRTPMNSIQILSKLLADNMEGNLTEKQKEFAKTIYNSGIDLLELINEILDLSKIEAGKMVLNVDEMSLRNLPNYIQQNFEHMAAVKNLYLKVISDDDLPENIITDRQRVEQILKNLISNALKFTLEGGITVQISKLKSGDILKNDKLGRQNTIKISVSDTGIGIPKDKQKLIFEAFQQADGTTSRKYGGTGLGLSISRELIKLLQGEIQLSSQEGKGSTFSVFLPFKISLKERDAEEKKNSETKRIIAKEPKKTKKVLSGQQPVINKKVSDIRDDRMQLTQNDKSILVIDDDPRFSRILFEFVRERGFKCILAEDGEAGLQMALQYRPSAIILDVGLPRIDGWEVMDRLKKNEATSYIPVYFISAHDKKSEAMNMGAVGYLTKPVSKDDLDNVFNKIDATISKKIKRILIIEDDKDMRKSMEELLNGKDVEIESIGNGKKALTMLKSNSYDCVVLDLGLKDISGFDLIEKIKSELNQKDLPVIVYTGKELNKEEQEALKEHAESIIIKGAKSPERLLDEINLFIHRVKSDFPKEKQYKIRNNSEKNEVLKDKKVMIVDDDVRNIFALSSVLEQYGINIEAAENGRQAIDLLSKKDDVDLVLMDIMMPEMDGYMAMNQIRKQKDFKKLPIIALTAKAMKGDRQKCIEAGANDYLAKPVDVEKLVSLMQVWLYR
ncbi:MAG: response regulator [Calditrichaceae bacterium]|nr:response regulator [Calditrichaceae bacterium]MBN2710420.1 response regulator [Calditrichaceae bacterium]RQV93641.1 MAG: response regulator [Calditrichota bacterium]